MRDLKGTENWTDVFGCDITAADVMHMAGVGLRWLRHNAGRPVELAGATLSGGHNGFRFEPGNSWCEGAEAFIGYHRRAPPHGVI